MTQHYLIKKVIYFFISFRALKKRRRSISVSLTLIANLISPEILTIFSCEQEKTIKYSPVAVVCSVDGVLDKEFQLFLKKLSDT